MSKIDLTSPQTEPHLLRVTERLRTTSGDVHPGWIRATSILLRGMERLRSLEAAEILSPDVTPLQ